MDVEEAEVVNGETSQSVTDAGVKHEYETLLASQRPSGGYPDDHRAGDQHRTCGEQNMEDEDEEVLRTGESHRQGDGGVEEHYDAPQENEPFIVFIHDWCWMEFKQPS